MLIHPTDADDPTAICTLPMSCSRFSLQPKRSHQPTHTYLPRFRFSMPSLPKTWSWGLCARQVRSLGGTSSCCDIRPSHHSLLMFVNTFGVFLVVRPNIALLSMSGKTHTRTVCFGQVSKLLMELFLDPRGIFLWRSPQTCTKGCLPIYIYDCGHVLTTILNIPFEET